MQLQFRMVVGWEKSLTALASNSLLLYLLEFAGCGISNLVKASVFLFPESRVSASVS